MPMRPARFAWLALRSLLAGLAAAATLVLATWASGELAAALGLPAGGQVRLGWDLSGVIFAGTLAFAVLARLAPAATRAHVIVGLVLLIIALAWAVARLGGDFPAWFIATLLLSVPGQAWLGWLAGRRAQ